ncbi:MAG: hypothetical protein KI793_29405 [Rivularia sp. (in: Bacteria)]|nr:hypothetical protein [Rivularia sp. MS3]
MAKKKDSWWLFSEIRKSLKHGKKRGAEINSYMEKQGWVIRRWEGLVLKYHLAPNFTPSREHVNQAVLSAIKIKVLLPMLEE